MRQPPWTEAEDALVLTGERPSVLVQQMDRTQRQITDRRKTLRRRGLLKDNLPPGPKAKAAGPLRTTWTAEQDAIVSTCETIQQAADATGRTLGQVRYRRGQLRRMGKPVQETIHGRGNPRKPEPEVSHEVKQRRCLICGHGFMSAWPGERVCRRCRGSELWRTAGGAIA